MTPHARNDARDEDVLRSKALEYVEAELIDEPMAHAMVRVIEAALLKKN